MKVLMFNEPAFFLRNRADDVQSFYHHIGDYDEFSLVSEELLGISFIRHIIELGCEVHIFYHSDFLRQTLFAKKFSPADLTAPVIIGKFF